MLQSWLPTSVQARGNSNKQKLDTVLDKLASVKRVKPDPVTFWSIWCPFVDDKCKTNRKTRVDNFKQVLNEHQMSAEPRKRHHPSEIAAIIMLDDAARREFETEVVVC